MRRSSDVSGWDRMSRRATYTDIDKSANRERLQVFGGFHAGVEDNVPSGTKTLLLLGPCEPGFWDHVSAQPEFHDGGRHPLDRWSERTIGALARSLNCKAVFPFGGPPYNPFIDWALRSGRCWESPVQFLVHDVAGLFVSFRGALTFDFLLDLPDTPKRSPCQSCSDRPCNSACPVGAIRDSQYDAITCTEHVGSEAGTDCLMRGCAVRRICPVSRKYGRSEVQSQFHQVAFLGR